VVAAEIADGDPIDIDTYGHRVVRVLVFKNELCFDAPVLTFVCSRPADLLKRVLVVRFADDGQSESIWTFEQKPVAWSQRGWLRAATEESPEESHLRAA